MDRLGQLLALRAGSAEKRDRDRMQVLAQTEKIQAETGENVELALVDLRIFELLWAEPVRSQGDMASPLRVGLPRWNRNHGLPQLTEARAAVPRHFPKLPVYRNHEPDFRIRTPFASPEAAYIHGALMKSIT